jgi:hypothetical protein
LELLESHQKQDFEWAGGTDVVLVRTGSAGAEQEQGLKQTDPIAGAKVGFAIDLGSGCGQQVFVVGAMSVSLSGFDGLADHLRMRETGRKR